MPSFNPQKDHPELDLGLPTKVSDSPDAKQADKASQADAIALPGAHRTSCKQPAEKSPPRTETPAKSTERVRRFRERLKVHHGQRVEVLLPADTIAWLDRAAAESGFSRSEMIAAICRKAQPTGKH